MSIPSFTVLESANERRGREPATAAPASAAPAPRKRLRLNLAWTYLLIAAAFEIVWAVALKKSDGWTPSPVLAIALLAYVASFVFLALALRDLPVGTAYAVWVGIGVVGVALFGVIWLGESRAVLRLACVYRFRPRGAVLGALLTRRCLDLLDAGTTSVEVI